jgi:hypothetical protein
MEVGFTGVKQSLAKSKSVRICSPFLPGTIIPIPRVDLEGTTLLLTTL